MNPNPIQPGNPFTRRWNTMSRKAKVIWSIVATVVILGLLAWGLTSYVSYVASRTIAEMKKETPAAADLSGIQEQIRLQGVLADGIIGSLSNLVRASDKLSERISINQADMSQRMDHIASGMASNLTAIRSEIPGIVEKSVAEKMAKAMEPLKRILTNPPPAICPPAVAHCPPPVAAKVSPAPTPPVAAVTTPSGVTNGNTLVLNLTAPQHPQQAQPVVGTTTATPSFVIHNNNTMVLGASELVTSGTNAPSGKRFWERKLPGF